MGRPIRMYSKDGVYFVTARTVQARFLLRPSAQLNEIVGGVLARAVDLHGVHVYGFVFASNHVHLLVHARDGTLSRFMQYLLGNLARKVAPLVGWYGPFWERRFSAEEVIGDEAVLGRLKYILAHGVKEGLVRRVTDWPGLSCAKQLLGGLTRRFRWFGWVTRWANGKLKEGGEQRYSEKWSETIEFTLALPPSWQSLGERERVEAAKDLIASIEREWRGEFPQVVGRARILSIDPHSRPESPKRTPRPPCHAMFAELRQAFIERYRAFREAYRVASERFRNGDLLVAFPEYSFRPPGYCIRDLAEGAPAPLTS